MSEPMLITGEGPVLRVGPAEVTHFAGLLANGEGAFGVAVAPDGAYLAYTCGMRPQVDAWYSGDWYRGTLISGEVVDAEGEDRERLQLGYSPAGNIEGALISSKGDTFPIIAGPASVGDGLFRRDDADGVLGAVALPGNTVCAVKRTTDGELVPAGTVPY